MAFLELVKHRKSVRAFLNRPVEREKILACLEAARLAPSACNSQPWKFIVVDDPQLKDRLGTCWIGWFNERTVKSILNVPKDKKLDILIALGYYDREKLDAEHGREPIEKIASFNSY